MLLSRHQGAGGVPIQLPSGTGAIFAITSLLLYGKSSCGSEGNILVLGFRKAGSNKYFNKIPLLYYWARIEVKYI